MDRLDPQTVFVTIAAIIVIVITSTAAYDIGRRHLVAEMKHYGCEKVLAIYQGLDVKK